MGEFRMPSLGADMTHGTLVQWNVKPGDAVKRGDIVAIVGTDKADIEVEVYETGTVRTLIAQPGEKLPVGAPLAFLEVSGEAAPSAVVPSATPPPRPQPAGRIHASPLARKLAEELGVDLAKVQGTGPDGIIERHDVERAAAAKPPVPAPPAGEPGAPAAEVPSGMRRAIAAAMARSNREIPHYYLSTQIDMSTAIGWLEQTNRERSIEKRVLPAALLLKGVARGLLEVPELNGYWVDDQLKPSAEIHLGVAVSLRTGGLMVPTIHSANHRSLDELMTDLRDIITRTRAGRLRSSDITDSTITITNLGDLGVETVFGVIYPPQVALVGFGKIVDRPWAAHGMLGVRPVLTATLAADHRATDGRRGAQFLDVLSSALQKPETL
ncbi:MAG TPA: dihydrolipoamide acetyltransferase family protein [Bryobacteraceae bacterium]|nr:dihydrolipoamide acetyltransferase family protein [Bryobacteraceae bacterium]